MNSNDKNPLDRRVILIVDDNPENLEILAKQLQEKQYEIEFASNGAAALSWLDIKKFDLILLDINMPGISGFEVCTKIRSDPGMDNVPIIFLSADTERESILKGFELGAQDYITKPFDNRELIVRVRTHLALKDRDEKLEELNKSLEDKVIERTRQLNEAVDKLEATNLKLIDLDKAKSEFVNLISHEIRTPLNGILGPLELLKGPLYPREIGDLIEMLDLSVKRLERFGINALLITRLKTKQFEIKKERIQLSKIINIISANENDDFKAKGLKLDVRKESNDDFIFGEIELIKNCLSNVLDNAIRFSPPNGIICVAIKSENNHLICEIRDHGKGFSSKAIDHVINLFTRGEEYSDNHPGIGLAIVKMIMESHNGSVSLGNHSEGGALVKLQFIKGQNQ